MTTSPSRIVDRICAATVIALCAMVLLHRVFGQGWAGDGALAAGAILVLAVMPRFGLREWILLAIAGALTAGLLDREGGLDPILEGASKAAYFSAFITLMMTLREAANTSASVLEVGSWITRQPPGRRFYAIWFGGHIAGILLNFGAVSLLAPLIQRGVRAGRSDTAEERHRIAILERRQLSALIRGFSMVICWTPTTLTQVIILASVPGIDPARAIAMGIGLSAVMLVVGRVEDLLRWGRPARRGEGPKFPRRAGLDLLFVYVLLVAGTLGVSWLAGGTLPQALMTVAPVMLVGWVVVQSRLGSLGDRSAGDRLAEIALVSLPRMAKDAFLLGTAGYIGIAAASLAPVDLIAHWIEAADLAPWLIVAALPVVVTLGGQVALSPMVMVVFLAAVISALPALPAAPEYIGLALGAGWSLAMTASPNASGSLMIAGATGVPPTTLTWRWNGVYSLAALTVMAVLAWLFVG